MDKQKQIEEMARIIYKDFQAPEKYIAEQLYNAGYRKIPENAVVLTDDNAEEIGDMIINSPQMQKAMQHLIQEWRKETAEKFAERAKSRATDIGTFEHRYEAVKFDRIDEICKELSGKGV